MKRLADAAEQLSWLTTSAGEEQGAGFDLQEWADSTWVLHAMYENPALRGLGTHDEMLRRRLAAGDDAPLINHEVNLDEKITLTGIAAGFVLRPGPRWRRIRWMDYLDRSTGRGRGCGHPPCHRWFAPGSWPVAIEPPPEGSLDQESLAALVEVLSMGSSDALDTQCYAYYAPLAAGDFTTPHMWLGPLRSISDLIDEYGGPYPSSPSNFWPVDRSWFVWTDWDLQGTKVNGARELVAAVRANDILDTIDWTGPST